MPTPTRTPSARVADNSDAMTFPKAIEEIIAGNKLTRLEWKNSNIYICLDGDLMLVKEDGTKHSLIVSSGDILGTDWVVVA